MPSTSDDTAAASTAGSPPNKRARTNIKDVTYDSKSPQFTTSKGKGKSDESILEPITPSVLTRTEELAVAYREATPYPHGMIHNFCREGFLGE